MKNHLNSILVICLLLSTFVCFGQTDSIPGIRLTGKNTGKAIILRWAPTTPGAWRLSNIHGYQLDRMEFTGEEDFNEVGYLPVTQEPIKPCPKAQWEDLAMRNDQAAIAAEMIYGEKTVSASSLFEQADQFNNRFSTALLAAEFSAEVAMASGLRFEDKNIDTSKRYLYRLFSLGSSAEYPIDTTYLLINGSDISTENPLKIHHVEELESAVELQWDRKVYEKYYSAYFIERSSDGRNFSRLNEIPYLSSPNEHSETSQAYITYKDSVDNYNSHFYRVVGINPFGELSQPSPVVKAMARDKTPPPAVINIKAEQMAQHQMKITWEVNSIPADLKGFMIARTNDPKGVATNLTEEILSPQTKSFVDTSYDELLNNWYFIAAIDTANNASVSYPVHGAVIDSIPPAPPTGLKGKIDSTGIVTLTWSLGKERDIAGYMVFSTNQADHVYANISNRPIMDTVFTDTLNIKVLTKHIYYKVVAVDGYYNHSDFSEPIELIKPDIVPPVAPVFTKYSISKEGIHLKWANSSSSDVVMHQLQRKSVANPDWQTILETTQYEVYTEFLDSDLRKGAIYVYRIIATDEAGLKSPVSYELKLKSIDFDAKLPVANLRAKVDDTESHIRLDWSYSVLGKYEFKLYKSVNGGPFLLLKNIQNSVLSFVDNKVTTGKQYEYAIRVQYNDGKTSPYSTIAKVEIPSDSD